MHFHIFRSDGEENNADISKLGPGAYGASGETQQLPSSIYMERMCTDINSLKKQYDRLKQRQNQAHIIIAAASASQQQHQKKSKIITPKIETPMALNHLFVGRSSVTARNRCVTASPRIASIYPQLHNSQPASRRSSVHKNSKLDQTVRSESSKSHGDISNVQQIGSKLDNCVNNNDVQKKDMMTNDINTDRNIYTSEIEKRYTVQQSKSSSDDSGVFNESDSKNTDPEKEKFLTDTADFKATSNESQISLILGGEKNSSHDSEIVNNQSLMTMTVEHSDITNNKCSTCSRDPDRHPVLRESSDYSIDASLDSGLCSTTNSVENSPISSKIDDTRESTLTTTDHHNDTSQQDVAIAQLQSNYQNGEIKLPSNSVKDVPKSSPIERSVSEDTSTRSTMDNQPTRSRTFSTDQALSDYARSKSKPAKIVQPFNPFPVKHFNENRKKNCVKLGLYKTSTLQEFERQCKSKYVWSK